MQLALLQEIPGVDWTLAAVIISELGVDMSVFGNVFTAGFMGGDLPRQQRIGRQAQEQPHPEGQCLSEDGFGEAANAAAKAKGTYLRTNFTVSKPDVDTSARP